MRAIAPGKVILSGEHSVVYGAPAIATAVKLYSSVTWTAQQQSVLAADMSPLSPHQNHRIEYVNGLVTYLNARYDLFSAKLLPISQVLDSPDQLVLYVLAQQLSNQQLCASLKVSSKLPLGAGMGSSASVIAATLVLCETITGNVLTPQERFYAVRHCERLQHGKGSLIDAATVVLGGVIQLREQQVQSLTLELKQCWYWLFTGTPQSSTGECVSYVASRFSQDKQLWQRFATCTNTMTQLLDNAEDPSDCIDYNQELLEHLNVVPATTQSLISRIKAQGASAKISGAGACSGDKSGLVIVYAKTAEIESFFTSLNLPWGKIEQDSDGARAQF